MGIYKTLLIAKWHYFWLLLRFFINALIDSWFILGKLVVAWEVFEATVHLLSSQTVEMRKDLYRIPFDVADVTWKSCHLIDVQSCFCFLIYFELPKPVIVAEDIACTSYTQKNKFKWICINTKDSKLKTYKRMRLEPFIYLLFVQEDLMIYYLFVSHWPLFDVISISVTEQNVRFSAILALNLALRTFWELSG